ncbi:hypothetical protein Q3G72_021286 [Acer saccharum]|nr:hypothetical protein Q3G72_021286 [Acer saccharum]
MALAENWLNHGGERHASKETKISPKTVSKLSLDWEFYAGKDISATPSIFMEPFIFQAGMDKCLFGNQRENELKWATLEQKEAVEELKKGPALDDQRRYAMNKNADFETVWEIKEKLCYVSYDYK